MSALSSLLILSALAAPQNQQRHPDAVEIYHWQLAAVNDVNYDGWPDGWRRYHGPGLPHYVDVELTPDEAAVGGQCLTVHVNGGGAHVESPGLSISDNYSYKLEARLRVANMRFARAQVRLEFCDADRQVLQTEASNWFTSTNDWVKIEIDPTHTENEEARIARVALYVESGEGADLVGTVSLDDVWLGRLPRMDVGTNSPFNVYQNPHDVEVTCDLSGILDQDPDIIFELLDASSKTIVDDSIALTTRLINERQSKSSDIVGATTTRAGYEGNTSWRPPIHDHGFYKVRVVMKSERGELMDRMINIAIVPPLESAPQGRFGWSLAGDDVPLSFDQLGKLLPRVAVNWVKIPVWYGENETKRGDQLVVLTERLAAQDIEVVGVVDRPPEGSELASRIARDAVIADTLSLDTSSWLPLLDPVLTRLSLRIRWWQLGDDQDVSYSSYPRVEQEIAKLRDQMFRFGQDVSLGIGWKWVHLAENQPPASWEFQQFISNPALTRGELSEYLQLPRRPGVDRWALIEPLSAKKYDLEIRARELVGDMLAAKIHGADAIFAAHPFDDDAGLMTDAGMPGELLLPWRTTASLLSSTQFIGSIQLPGQSENLLFETPTGEMMMVVWNERPTQEVLHLGENIRVVDVFGREKRPDAIEHRQVIDVDALPKFVRGLNPHIARWRMQLDFKSPHIPSVFGKTHRNQVVLANTFPQGVGGRLALTAPDGWQVLPRAIDFKLAENETASKLFETALPFDANSGPAPIRADFVVSADRTYHFSVYRELNVGDGEVELEVHTRVDDDGWLIVEQRMSNASERLVDFKCLLYAPGRRRQRIQVFRLGSGADVKIYRYPRGAELLGAEMWLRAEEVNGTRVINHRFIAEQ